MPTVKRKRTPDDDVSDDDDGLNAGESGAPRRTKVSKACNACKDKHDRCDGGEPICANCRRRGTECSYERVRQAPGPQRGWLNNLKNRIISLESLLLDQKQGESAGVNPTEASSGVNVRSRSEVSEGNGKKEKLRTILDDALNRLELLVVELGQQRSGERQWLSNAENPTMCKAVAPESDPAFLELLNQVDFFPDVENATKDAILDLGNPSALGDIFAPFNGLYRVPETVTLGDGSMGDSENLFSVAHLTRPLSLFDDCDPLPPAEVLNELFAQYFKHTWEYRFIYPAHPMVHRPTFMSTISSQNPLLIYAMLAHGSSCLDVDPSNSRQLALAFFARCKKLVFPALSDSLAGVWLVQALLIMAQFANCLERTLSYSLLGLCVSKSREMGLHIDPDIANRSESPAIHSEKWIENEERRRTGWAVYVLDRIAAVGNSRSPILVDRDLSLSAPCSDELWEANPFGLLRGESSPGSSDSGRDDSRESVLELYTIIGKAQLLKLWQDTKKLPTVLVEFEGPLSTWHDNFIRHCPGASEPPFSARFDAELARGLLIYHFAGVIVNTPFDIVSAPASWVASDNYRKALFHWICVRQMIQRFHRMGKWLSSFGLFCIFHCALVSVASIRCRYRLLTEVCPQP
ncbi:hypothetical protein M427DRAFT_300573 [Gonapodya prolifera JEL478]|uniref:Zn(2)-C6 fungal-type domain-containing protein n=1 Tax=Gonapodya prolifera (strain JEL478) TaxID=1344416 RepID=A0A139AGY7_GONPJ|nr:hypothetical protein M427DRAFT_300573 [Gonapodya prolifera JEL478]|eukprot:KXS16092.1 hypothetical protein M427DRAFT_300573 [Gonapodya prolifera JEL478]